MQKTDYLSLVHPAVEQAVELMIMSEEKYGEGLFFSDNDAQKVITHAESSIQGLQNEDGKSHATAALARAIKVVLREIEHDRL